MTESHFSNPVYLTGIDSKISCGFWFLDTALNTPSGSEIAGQ